MRLLLFIGHSNAIKDYFYAMRDDSHEIGINYI